jgi:phosphoribosylglycinamide formyltransferase-1
MKPPRIVVLLSGGGRTLVNLMECIRRGELSAEIPLVISSRAGAKGIERARALGLQVEVLRPRDFESREAFVAAQSARIAREAPDLILMAGYLLHFPVPEGFAGRVLNIHPSLLPRYGGKGMYGDHVHAAVLAAHEKTSGCTVHVVDDVYDNGPVVLQAEVPVLPDDTVDSLAARVFEAECETYPEAIRRHAVTLGLDAGARDDRVAGERD